MKKQLITIAVALLTAGALTTSCSSEDNIANEPQTQQPAGNTITLTATLAPKGDDGGTTRAITTGKDGENKEILNVAWAADEEISIIRKTKRSRIFKRNVLSHKTKRPLSRREKCSLQV